MKKITLLDNMVQAHVLESLLKEQGIPHLVVSYHCSAYDGIFQDQKGWGHLEAPEEHEGRILELIEQLKSQTGQDARRESPESDPRE